MGARPFMDSLSRWQITVRLGACQSVRPEEEVGSSATFLCWPRPSTEVAHMR
jgi:hypothetical protein